MACDFHGHSKKKNVFIYGCENGPGENENLEKVHTKISNIRYSLIFALRLVMYLIFQAVVLRLKNQRNLHLVLLYGKSLE